MKNVALVMLALVTTLATVGAEQGSLDANLQPLQPFLGSWRGEFKGSTPEKPMIDVSFWERALNGKAVRVIHSINEGSYGGETFITWDAEKKGIVYHYFTTAGFQTKGTMQVDGKKLVCHELVTGSAGGATEVKATYELREDGTLQSKANYLKNGSWEEGREVTYKRAEGVKPVFK